MESTFVFFATASHEEVEAAVPLGFRNGYVTRGDDHFYLRRYSLEEQREELEGQELQTIVSILGSHPTAAFEVACRHGPSARLALDIVSQLMQSFASSALDNDCGRVFSAAEVIALQESHPVEGIYATRRPPGSMQ